MESNYVVNVKTKVGTIITVRGNDSTEFESNINALVGNGVNNSIAAMEELFLGVQPSNSGVNTVVNALGGTVISETPMPVAQALPAPTSAPTVAVVAQPSNKAATNTQTLNAAPPKPVQQAAKTAAVSAAAPIQKAQVAAPRTIVAVIPTPLAKTSVTNMAKTTQGSGASTRTTQLKPIAKPITAVKVAPKTRP